MELGIPCLSLPVLLSMDGSSTLWGLAGWLLALGLWQASCKQPEIAPLHSNILLLLLPLLLKLELLPQYQ